MVKRDNFTSGQKEATFKLSAHEVKLHWPEEFKNSATECYMCAHCRFVHSDRALFEVDHLVSCKEGGSSNREKLDRIRQLQVEVNKSLDKQDIGILMAANLNDQLLCIGCKPGQEIERAASRRSSGRMRLRLPPP